MKKSNKKKIQTLLTAKYFGEPQHLAGYWYDDVNWSSYFIKPSLGHDTIIAWRFAKNRLADPSYLCKAQLRTSSRCPWCDEVADSWHMIISCSKNRQLWTFIIPLLRKLLPTESISAKSLFCGFNSTTKEANLANFFIVLGKSTVYYTCLSYLRGERRRVASYKNIFVAKLKSRIYKEYAWHSQRDSLSSFEKVWCPMSVLCCVKNGSLIFSREINL